MTAVRSQEVEIRDFRRKDIPALVQYWTENSAEFWRARGVDPTKLMARDEFIAKYESIFAEVGDVKGVAVIVFRGLSIGVHTLTSLIEGESAIFHAHIWSEEHRGQGIGVFSYLKASEFFMKKLSLKKIVFKTPKLNQAANRIKEKIGIPKLGDIIFDAPILINPLDSNLYEIDINLLSQLKLKHGINS